MDRAISVELSSTRIRVPTVRESREKSGNFEGVRENREGQGKVREF